MNESQFDMEQIVREVLRRLREMEPTKEQQHAAIADSTIIEMPDRLITLATLQGKLAGVKQLVVLPGAVVTPAARDELKVRQIGLKWRSKQQSKTSAINRLVIASAATCGRAAALLKSTFRSGLRMEHLHVTNWKEAVSKMTQELQATQDVGLIMTNRPAATACLANRNEAIRAAAASDISSARDAIDTLGANLLAVDPSALSLHALRNIVREYVERGAL